MSADLPSFLTRTTSGYVLMLSASAAECEMLCPAKYSWSRVTGIEAAVPRAGQNYGKALHLALAHRYSHLDLSLAQAEEEALALIGKHFAENPQPELGSKGKPEWRTALRAAQALREYNKRYPAEDFEVLGVERQFECPLGTFGGAKGDLVEVRWHGIEDLLVNWHDSRWVLDTKTMGEWSDLTADEGKCSFQFQGYAWHERQAGQCAGAIGNYIISRAPYAEGRKPTPRDLPRDQFERISYAYSDAQLDEWHARAMGIAREIFAHWQEGEWPQRSTACAHWGRCEYYRLCWETDPAYKLSAALSADYRPRTPSPLGRERQQQGPRLGRPESEQL